MVSNEFDLWIDSERERLRRLADDTQADLEALERVAVMRKRAPRAAQSASQTLGVSPEEIEGLSVLEAALLIADRNDGVLLSTPARELMVKARVLEDVPAASTALYAVLNDSGHFEKGEKRATYLLSKMRLVAWAEDHEQPDDDPIPTRVAQ
jgi:hypothetical protein